MPTDERRQPSRLSIPSREVAVLKSALAGWKRSFPARDDHLVQDLIRYDGGREAVIRLRSGSGVVQMEEACTLSKASSSAVI